MVTAAISGAEAGVRTTGARASRCEVTIRTETRLTLSVQTRALQIIKTEERVWAALARGHRGH